MKIRLLRDVLDANKTLRSTVHFGHGTAFEWREGVEMEVSEATGKEMIKAGDAVAVTK
jgi:hypothetical protein